MRQWAGPSPAHWIAAKSNQAIMSARVGARAVMQNLIGHLLLPTGISWEQSSDLWDYEEGLRISFPLDGEIDSRQAVRIVTNALQRDSVLWLRPGRDKWLVDVPQLRTWLDESGKGQKSDFLASCNWLQDSVAIKVDVERTSRDAFGKPDPYTYVRLEIRRGDYVLNSKSKIFLSHKGADKPIVRRFSTCLQALGFSPWLDEDDMPAGTELHRGIREGFKNSCAAVFFITPAFKDESYLKGEINYAIEEKTARSDKFAIITLAIADGSGNRGVVPDMLHSYVWKEPDSELQGLTEIVRALPIRLGPPDWK